MNIEKCIESAYVLIFRLQANFERTVKPNQMLNGRKSQHIFM